MTTRYRKPSRQRLYPAIAGAILIAAGAGASAEDVDASLQLEYECPFPIIGNQVLIVDINATIPAEETPGETAPFDIITTTTVPDVAREALKISRVETSEGTAISSSLVELPERDIPVEVSLDIPTTTVPSEEGPFQMPATGVSPSVTLQEQDIGEGRIRVGALQLHIINLQANGRPAFGDVGEFTSDCTLLPGQDNVLHTFQIVSDETGDPQIAVDPEALDFGAIQSGMSADKSLTVSNAGDDGLSVEAIELQGPDADLFSTTDDCNPLAAGDSCTIDVNYTAVGDQSHEATLVIHSNDPATPQLEVPLQAVSEEIPAPAIEVAPGALDFGTVQAGQTPEDTITVSNAGGAALGIENILLEGPDSARFLLSDDCSTLDPTQSCTLSLTYLAQGDETHNATVRIESGDPENPVMQVPVTGHSEIEPQPVIHVEPQALDFGEVPLGSTVEETVTVNNTGGAPLTINGVTVEGMDSGDFTETNDCTTLSPEQSCTVKVNFTSNEDAERSAVLSIRSDDPEAPQVDVPLSGRAQVDEVIGTLAQDMAGETYIRSAQGSIPLSGEVIAEVEEATGLVSGLLALDDTEATLRISRLFRRMTTDLHLRFEPVEETHGQLENGTLATTTEVFFRVPHATLNFFGLNLPLAGGEQCRTMDPVTLALATPEGESFSTSEGGPLEGEYRIPPLENCGPLTGVLNSLLAGGDNTMMLNLTPQE